ncbi:nuclear transport factor 2 family protein [Pacificimonas sp. WHA3]|uniref:Nuclear transport factor 2 family protein n=1 Tax=Pacificimonas pallii TaxID=2827236 RepID=A0ABS6SE54_9SPHN|nr:nuclear transport factor 2 family protein [Pacificimonas pallii]MBV7256685.1 nuclear transport factor 2 family protein [Pacificimonas pallii]
MCDREIRDWCARWSEQVRRRDIAGGQKLFCDDVVAFGTRNRIMHGLDELARLQWTPTWNATSDFTIHDESVFISVSNDGHSAWLAGLWSSTGIADDGTTFPRGGRVTLAFRKDGNGAWLCVHSHLSDQPSPDL